MTKYLMISLVFISSCSPINERKTILENYPYYNQLDSYFSKNTKTKLFKSLQEDLIEFLFIIPLDSCSNCITETLERIIQNNSSRIGVIFLGKPKNDYHEELRNEIKKINSSVYSEIENEIQLFETNVFGPTFFIAKENNNIYYTPLTNQIWQDLTIELGWD